MARFKDLLRWGVLEWRSSRPPLRPESVRHVVQAEPAGRKRHARQSHHGEGRELCPELLGPGSLEKNGADDFEEVTRRMRYESGCRARTRVARTGGASEPTRVPVDLTLRFLEKDVRGSDLFLVGVALGGRKEGCPLQWPSSP